MFRHIVFTSLVLFSFGALDFAHAEDAAKTDAPAVVEEKASSEDSSKKPAPQPASPENVEKQRASAEKVFDRMRKMSEKLKPEEQKHFFTMYNNYNMIGTVKMVQSDVANAITACGQENPEIKSKLDARFSKWKDAVAPVIKEAETNVDNMVVAQDYADAKEIKSIFKTVDEMRSTTNKQIDKQPVSNREACDYLLGKMDDTQENFVQLLRATLVSVPPSPQPEPAKAPAEDKPSSEPAVQDEKKI